jgi:murein tripeptide amidase MpaA
MSIQINSGFDSGNIRVIGIEGDRVDLEIVTDHLSDFYQWFHFRVAGAKGRTLTFRITNAGGAAYAFGWPGYKARWSTDREAWRTAESSYADGVLTFTKTFDTDLAWFAYFAPYSMERHHDLVSSMALMPGVRHRELGKTLDGQPMDLLTLGTGPKTVWLYARQHPGETMAEWWMEGALEFLTDPTNQTALAPAREGRVPHRAQHEPGRLAPRPSAHQRGRCEPQPRMACADDGEEPRSVPRPRGDGRDRLRLRDGHPRRRGDPGQLPGRL